MVLFKRIFGIAALLFGVVFIMVGVVALFNPPEGDDSPIVTALGIIAVLGLIPSGFGTWLLKSARDQVRNSRTGNLDQAFYALLRDREATIADFDFAIQNKITRQEAREFLEQKCTELGASADANDRGMVTYTFGG